MENKEKENKKEGNEFKSMEDDLPQIKEEDQNPVHLFGPSKRTCPRCKQEIVVNTGLHNWKNLFRAPSLDDWITLFILIMIFFSMWAYKHDTAECVDFVKNIDNVCINYKTNMTIIYKERFNYSLNYSDVIFNYTNTEIKSVNPPNH